MIAPPPGYLSHFARLAHVLELRREGKTYQQIADRVGLSSPQRAQTMVAKAIKRILRETAEEIRSVELSRLEVLIRAIWDRALTDIEGADPDFQRFDRLKQLLESKLRWCGAQAMVEDHSDKRVQIYIQQFTGARPAEIVNPVPLPDNSRFDEELALIMPDEAGKVG